MAPGLLKRTNVETKESSKTQLDRTKTGLLKSQVVCRFLWVLTLTSAAFAVALSAATHFGYLPEKEVDSNATFRFDGQPSIVSEPSPSIFEKLFAPPGNLENEVPAEFVTTAPQFDRELVLNDFENRIADEFAIPANLRDRVGFWFDVYTKYDDNRRIIHHARFPWVIYQVVDVSPIINSDTPKRRWMRNEKADKFVQSEANKIRAALVSLAHKRSAGKLNATEQMVADALKALGPDVRKNARNAVGETRVQMGQKNFFEEGLEISPRYLGAMEKIFQKNKLPVELTRLPFVESSFNKHATSKVGAAGLWQFMGNTGRKFMIVNDSIDERRSPFKATEAAARLLKENHMILHRSWPLAITAWNHGPGGIRKAAKAAGTRDLGSIVKSYRSKSFDFASSNFFCEFLAALHAERYNDIIFGDIPRETALEVHVVRLPRAVRVSELIRVSGLSRDEFLLVNPDLRAATKSNAYLPAGFRLHVPSRARTGIERHLAIGSELGTRRSS